MNKIAIAESLKTCLGQPLTFAYKRLHEVEGVDLSELDLAEIVLIFGDGGTVRYLCWDRVDSEYELSVKENSHLLAKPFPEMKGPDDAVLSESLGKRLSDFDLYGDDEGRVFAILFDFGGTILAIAVGYGEWHPDSRVRAFRYFSGDDLFLWSAQEFNQALKTSSIEILSAV